MDQPVLENTVARTRWRIARARLPLLLIVGTIAVIAVLVITRPRLVPLQKPERVWPVEAIEATYRTVQPDLNLYGEVVAGRRSELLALASGRIVAIGESFDDGGAVRKGDLLLQIDPFEYQTGLADQRSQLKEAEVRLEMLRRDHERAKELFAEKNVSEQFMDSAELDMQQQEAIVEQREIGVLQAERDLADTKLLAPFDGVLSNVNADLGQQISGFGANKVADIIDTSELEVRFSLSNAQYGRLFESGEPVVGRPVEISWQVGRSTLSYDGVIERVGAEIVSTTGGIDVYAVIDSVGEQTDLRPGAFVAVSMPDKQYTNVLQVPDSALYAEDIVYVIADGRMAARKIRIHGFAGTSILFSSAGDPAIASGDLLVTTQLREGGEGAKVEVR